jgi:hypothetical protein
MHIESTRGQFGYEEERVFHVMIGMNKKGGMANDEFNCYIENGIVPLFSQLGGKNVVHNNSKRIVLACFDAGMSMMLG